MSSSRRISFSDSRLVVSMTARAFSASCGRSLMTKCPTPAWTAMTLIEWATTSCSSRAIRSRSSWTVAFAYRSLYAAAAPTKAVETEPNAAETETEPGVRKAARVKAASTDSRGYPGRERGLDPRDRVCHQGHGQQRLPRERRPDERGGHLRGRAGQCRAGRVPQGHFAVQAAGWRPHAGRREHHRGGRDIDRDPVPELQTPGQVHRATVPASTRGPRQTVAGFGVDRAPTRGGRSPRQGYGP
jgi:hypothetical protein